MKNTQILKRFLLIISTAVVCFLAIPGYAEFHDLEVKYTNLTGDTLIYNNTTCKHGQVVDFPHNIQDQKSITASFKTWRGIGIYGPDCTVTFTGKDADRISIGAATGFRIPSLPHAYWVAGMHLNFITTAVYPSYIEHSSSAKAHPGVVYLQIIKVK